MDSFFEVRTDTQQFNAWIGYFHRIGWMPYTLKNIEFTKEHSWTAPCEWPNDLPAAKVKTGGIVG